MADLAAGGNLAAADALRKQQTFTRAQVAYIAHLAYESGRTAAYRDDLAELHGTWARHRAGRRHAELVAERVAEYSDAAARLNARLGRPLGYRYDGGPVGWETAWPARRIPDAMSPDGYAICPCPRTGPRTDEHPSGHVVGWESSRDRRAA